MNSKILLVSSLILGLGLASCDKSTTPTAPPAGEAESGAAAAPGVDAPAAEGGEEPAASEPGAPDVAWGDKSFKQRQEFMGVVFLKEMKTMFQAHDENTYKGFKCQTCHGDDMKEQNFAMPSDSIYPLPTKDTIKAAMDYDEKVTKFMIEEVVPKSAELLNMDPYDPATGKGFGCFGCHPTE